MKTYKKPFVKIVDTKGQVILAGSGPTTHDEKGDGSILSKRGIFDYESE